jgi:hypothetical protein
MPHRSALPAWIALACVLTVGAGVLLVAEQQHLRSDANHPQVEMARSAASKLGAGADASTVVPSGQVDIRRSAAPYLIIVGADLRVLASSAELDGRPVVPPQGVFDFVRSHGEDVISWQPATGVRSAIVVDSFRGGYVVAGRSLAATEDSESFVETLTLAAWAVALVALGAIALFRRRPSAP